MKIYKSELQQIIREEILREARELKGDPIEIYGGFAKADQKLNQLSKDVKDFPEDVDGTIASLRQDLENLRKQVLGM